MLPWRQEVPEVSKARGLTGDRSRKQVRGHDKARRRIGGSEGSLTQPLWFAGACGYVRGVYRLPLYVLLLLKSVAKVG